MATTIWAPKRPDYEAFFEAVSAGELENMKAALTPSMDLNALVGDGWEGKTALHLASAAGNVDLVEFLIASGASVDTPDRSPHGASTPLHDAAFFGRSSVVEILLDHGANINAIGEEGGTALHQVLRNKEDVEPKYIETIRLLLDRGHDINSVALDLGGTILHQAAELESLELIQLLLDRGANLNPDLPTYSVISTAAAYGNYEVAKLLIKRAVKVDKDALARASSLSMLNLLISHADSTTMSSSGALHAACMKGSSSIDLVALMLDKNFDIEAVNDHGDTPLLSACGSSHVSSEVVGLLLSKGAAVTARSAKSYTANIAQGDTPLHRAAWRSDPKVVELLLEAGADLTTRNDEGQTPLIKFASTMNGISSKSFLLDGEDIHPRLQVLKMLIDGGADVNAVDVKHRSSLHALALCGESHNRAPHRSEAVDLLVKAGIAIEAADSEGRTAMDIFSDQDDYEMTPAKFLAMGPPHEIQWSLDGYTAAFTTMWPFIYLPDQLAWDLNADLEFEDFMFIPPSIDCKMRDYLPDVTLNLAGHDFVLSPYDYTLEWPIERGHVRCVSVFSDSGLDETDGREIVLGSAFVRKFYAIFDWDLQTVGFAKLA